jgi:hypothetical protein
MPFYVFMVVLNLLIIGFIVQFALVLPFLPERVQESGWGTAIRSAAWALLLLVPTLIIIRETQRASIRATGHDYVVLSNELFAQLYHQNRDGLRFILGHELGHIRLHHVSLWYQLSVAYSERIPILGPTLSRLREYSCDRHGARLCPLGATGLVLLASGRHTENVVDVDQLVQQGRQLRGVWVWLAQLPQSRPFTVRRLERLYGLGLFHPRVREPEPETTM